MIELFKAAVERGASDIHVKSGDFVRIRLHGRLVPLTQQRLDHEQVRQLAMKLVPHDDMRARLDQLFDYDCSWGVAGLGRFRVNILKQRGHFSIVLRVIPIDVPTFVVVSAITLLIALLASLLPAHRASRADPIRALRTD